jgi:RNA-directed DNA polymerase
MAGTKTSVNISTRIDKIAYLARKYHDKALTPLSHHIDIEWLHEAYHQTRKDGATGIDGQTMAEYETALEENLRSLLERAKSGL